MKESSITLAADDQQYHFRASFSEGCKDSIPVCLTFLFLFFSIGSLLNKSGYTLIQSILMTLTVHAAPLQVFLAQNSDTLAVTPLVVATLLVNFRFLIMASVLSEYFKSIPLYKVLWSTQLLSISTFTLSNTKKDKVRNLYSYYLGCGTSTLTVAIVATFIGFLVTANENNYINILIAMILPVHFTALTGMSWPKIKPVVATVIGFVVTPFAGSFVGDYQVFIVPFLIGGLLITFDALRGRNG